MRDRYWHMVAALIFAAAVFLPFREVVRAGLTTHAPVFPRYEGNLTAADTFRKYAYEIDTRFHVFGIARNAHALTSSTATLFEADHCYPTKSSLALGEPMITLGLLAVPARLATGDPIAAYNTALLLSTLLAGLGMYWLVISWTGVPAAGLAAGLYYAFYSAKLGAVSHPFINDTVWTVLALLFAQRWFAKGRWTSVFGMTVATCLQLCGSFYPTVAAALLAIPLGVGIVYRYGIRNISLYQVAFAAIGVGMTIWAVYSPFIEIREALDLPARAGQTFKLHAVLAPGGERFFGWTAIALAVAAFLPTRRSDRPRFEPKVGLILGSLLVVGAATTSGHPMKSPWLYDLLSTVVPGLDSVRRPGEIISGVHLCMSVLVGIGAAHILSWLPDRYSAAGGAAVGLIVFTTTLQPLGDGSGRTIVYRALSVRPSPGSLTMFDDLAKMGNDGPILELPIGDKDLGIADSKRILHTLFHRRRTSACYTSYIPDTRDQVRDLGLSLPAAQGIEALREIGFTTVLIHHDRSRDALQLESKLRRAAATPFSGIALLSDGPLASAWSLSGPTHVGE